MKSANFNNNHTLLQYLGYVLARIISILLSFLPLGLVYRLGEFMGLIIYAVLPNRRKIVLKNIKLMKAWYFSRSFKDTNNCLFKIKEDHLIRKIFRQNAGNFLFSVALLGKPESIWNKHISMSNLDRFKMLTGSNKSLIILFAHQGPWELLSLLPRVTLNYFPEEMNFASIYRPLKNSYIDNWFKSLREANGMKLISRNDGFLSITRFLKNNGILLVAMDIRLRQGKLVPLFGENATTTTIPSTLKKLSKSKSIALRFKRIGKLKWEINWNELGSNIVHSNSEKEFLKSMNEYLENIILEEPKDYFFFQDRYKVNH